MEARPALRYVSTTTDHVPAEIAGCADWGSPATNDSRSPGRIPCVAQVRCCKGGKYDRKPQEATPILTEATPDGRFLGREPRPRWPTDPFKGLSSTPWSGGGLSSIQASISGSYRLELIRS